MFIPSSVRFTLLFVVFAAVPLLAVSLGMAPNAARAKQESENLTKLLKERKALLEQAVQIVEQEYRSGRGDLESVLELRRDLLHSELELAASREERTKLYRQFLEHALAWEKTATELYKSGQVTQVDVLKAKAAVLQSQIDLERAKLKTD